MISHQVGGERDKAVHNKQVQCTGTVLLLRAPQVSFDVSAEGSIGKGKLAWKFSDCQISEYLKLFSE